jgi:hypothetical protein
VEYWDVSKYIYKTDGTRARSADTVTRVLLSLLAWDRSRWLGFIGFYSGLVEELRGGVFR